MKRSGVPMNTVVTFYAPHPGFLGAAAPLPTQIKKVVDELSGKSMTLRKAITKIKRVIEIGKLSACTDCILLELRSRGYIHAFRLIKFR